MSGADSANGLRIIVLGYIVRGPLGGLAWHHLQYVLGLLALGHDVYFLEDSDDYPACYDPARDAMDTDPSAGLRFAARTFERLGLRERWAYHDAHTERWLGPLANRATDLCRTADMVLNVSGVNPVRPWWRSIPHRVLIDTDPVFTQIRHLQDADAMARAHEHTAFFSFGENFGLECCTVPNDGLPWQATRQPVTLDVWPVTPGRSDAKFTTVMQWDSYRALVHEGRRYGMKSDSFAPYLALPQRVGPLLELAVGSASAPIELLRKNGWATRNPLEPTRDPWTYQQYIQRSKAEFGVAKHGYVVTNSGWFSERSAAYLASGRPVVVQETGFSRWLEVDGGVLPFNTPAEAEVAIKDVDRRYEWHCNAARTCAEEYFDASKILSLLIESIVNVTTG